MQVGEWIIKTEKQKDTKSKHFSKGMFGSEDKYVKGMSNAHCAHKIMLNK